MSIHANVRMSKTIIIKVGVRTYAMYANCRTLSSSLNPLTNFTSSSSRSTKFEDILHQNIFQMVTKTVPISMRVVISYAMKWDILFWIYWKVNGNWENNISISQWREYYCRTNTSTRRNKSTQKTTTVRVTVRDLSRKVNHLSKVIRVYNRVTELLKLYQSSPRLLVPPE